MIRNILLDQGGVIVDLKRDACLDALRRLGMSNPEELIGLYVQSGPFEALESGKIGVDEFHALLRPYFPAGVTDAQVDSAFSSFIDGIPVSRLHAIRQLRRRYRTYILSNTNPIMMNGVIGRLFTQEGLTIHEYFDGIILSYEAGSCKPDRGIFDYAVNTFGLDPAESLFLDDGKANITAARALGFHAALVPPGVEFSDVLAHVM